MVSDKTASQPHDHNGPTINSDSNNTAVDTVRITYVQILDIYWKYQKYIKKPDFR